MVDTGSGESEFATSAVSGSRELEQIFFGLKWSLKRIKLGDYIWDDFLIYLAEVCRGLEVVEINCAAISDGAIAHLLCRAEHLTALDVSLCPNFTGMAFAMVEDEHFKSRKLRWVKMGLVGHELKMAQERIKVLVPDCQMILMQPIVKNSKHAV